MIPVDGGPGVRVLVWYREPEEEPAALHHAFELVEKAMRGTPGLIRSELLRSVVHSGRIAVHSEWTSLDAFLAWEQGAEHRRDTGPLRPFQDTGAGQVYDVYTVDRKRSTQVRMRGPRT